MLEVRFSQSLVIYDEGPHLDLLNLPARKTKWIKMKGLISGRWSSKFPGEEEFEAKPLLSQKKVRSGVLKLIHGKPDSPRNLRWLELGKTCKPPYDSGNCTWANSLIEIRLIGEDRKPKPILNISLPMGC